MNLKMIAEIMLALESGKRVGISKNIGTQFYADYQKIDGKLYRMQGTEKILQGGFDCNNITHYLILEEQPETKIEKIEKRLQNIERRLSAIEKAVDKFETPVADIVFV